ncbi:MAG: formyltransferase family protein [Rhodopirellula sp. JB055]|uniref:formyltransferase family protein n=1 Tax=Rhodopirellula sp. JB055 TaxID=3342846 RepID=UPI00370A64D4
MLRFGVIGSAGGSSFFSALDCLGGDQNDFAASAVVNRACGLSDRCSERSVPWKILPYHDRESFSERCASHFHDQGIQNVILYYDRLLQASTFESAGIRVVNIHPSLLPSFPGMNSVEKAYRRGVKILGSTLHRIDEGVDTGPIIAQVCSHLADPHNLQRMQTISYIQKTYLNLVWFSLLKDENSPRGTAPIAQLINCPSHALTDNRILERFNALCSSTLP